MSRTDNVSYCLDTSKTEFIESKDIKSRVLTPRERFRLMGYDDKEYSIDGISFSGTNNLTGNGWDLTVAKLIIKEMLKGELKNGISN